GFGHLEETAEQPALATMRATAAKAAPDGLHDIALRPVGATEYLVCHHHLLPRPARLLVVRSRPERRRDLWNERTATGIGRGSDSISNRIAPAIGAISTRRTSTRSARRYPLPLRSPTRACAASS